MSTWSLRTLVAAGALGAVLFSSVVPGVAVAQLRAGVALASILAEGEHVLSVEAPDSWDLPTRVRLACGDGATTACARIDVWVLDSTDAADRRFTAVLLTSTTDELVERTGLGERGRADTASGRAAIAVARRANVVYVVRALRDDIDAAMFAARIDAATRAAPSGDARATRADPAAALSDPGEGASRVLPIPSGFLDVRVTASGSASARRTTEGWLVARGSGEFGLFAWVVDDRLRVGNIGISLDPLADETIRHPLGH